MTTGGVGSVSCLTQKDDLNWWDQFSASSNHWADDAEKEKQCPRKKENHVSHEIGLSYLAH